MASNPLPVIYEVNLEVQPQISGEFEAWLDEHIAELLALPGFCSAQRFRRVAAEEGRSGPDGGPVLLTVHYTLSSREALEEYFQTHAPRMREAGLKRWPGQFTATRRILYTA